MITHAEVAREIAATGLIARGAFHPDAGDAVPAFGDGSAVATVVMVGNAGGSMWAAFSASREFASAAGDLLDAWSRRVIGELALKLGAGALFPFDGPPWLPFQRWAQRADVVFPSPIGPLVHPRYGLWHAWRGALVFRQRMMLAPREEMPRPCDTCDGQPCLQACPVDAFSTAGYDVGACVAHVDGVTGGQCRQGGCLARHACPIGRDFTYEPAQQRFHMAAFLRARRAGAR